MRNLSRMLIFFFVALDLILLVIILKQHVSFAIFEPAGIMAEREKNLFVMVGTLGLMIILSVISVAFFIVWKYREDRNSTVHETSENKALMLLWWLIPTSIITFLAVLTWNSTHVLDPYKPIESTVKPLRIQVVSLQWKWLFIYPEQHIATVNYIVFPEKTPINFELTADSPMNSFWIPRLGGQMYSMTGMVTRTHLMASTVGEFQGQTAEISGAGFAGMKFIAKATTLNDFSAWVEKIQTKTNPLNEEVYKNLAKPSEDMEPVFYAPVDDNLYNYIVTKYMPSSQSRSEQQNDSMSHMY